MDFDHDVARIEVVVCEAVVFAVQTAEVVHLPRGFDEAVPDGFFPLCGGVKISAVVFKVSVAAELDFEEVEDGLDVQSVFGVLWGC